MAQLEFGFGFIQIDHIGHLDDLGFGPAEQIVAVLDELPAVAENKGQHGDEQRDGENGQDLPGSEMACVHGVIQGQGFLQVENRRFTFPDAERCRGAGIQERRLREDRRRDGGFLRQALGLELVPVH